jgi:hypothetical protein
MMRYGINSEYGCDDDVDLACAYKTNGLNEIMAVGLTTPGYDARS